MMDDSVSSNDRESLWRERGFEWLRQERQFEERDPDTCLRILGENPTSREAAFALFWGTYLRTEQPPTLADRHAEAVMRLLENGDTGGVASKDIPSLAFVKLHLAGVLAVSLIRPDIPVCETPSLVTILENAVAAHPLCQSPQPDVGDAETWGKELAGRDLFAFSAVLVQGMLMIALASIYARETNYEQALVYFTVGALYSCATTIPDTHRFSSETHDMEFHYDGFFPTLPHSGHTFDIQEAADVFEGIKKLTHRDPVDWSNVKACCSYLWNLASSNPEFCDLSDEITDSDGQVFGASEYWAKAITFAEERMRIDSLPYDIPTIDAREFREAERRLERDFLPDSWQDLSEEARKCLVKTEIAWAHERLDDMSRDIRIALECILPSVFGFWQETTRRSKDPRLPLTRIRDDLRGNSIIQAYIRVSKMDAEDTNWVMDGLPSFLGDVIDLRNYFEKRRHLERRPEEENENLDKAIVVRRKLLGIGWEGVLLRLMRVKRSLIAG